MFRSLVDQDSYAAITFMWEVLLMPFNYYFLIINQKLRQSLKFLHRHRSWIIVWLLLNQHPPRAAAFYPPPFEFSDKQSTSVDQTELLGSESGVILWTNSTMTTTTTSTGMGDAALGRRLQRTSVFKNEVTIKNTDKGLTQRANFMVKAPTSSPALQRRLTACNCGHDADGEVCVDDTCPCETGFDVYQGECVDFDECVFAKKFCKGDGARCSNEPGTFECTCGKGFTPNEDNVSCKAECPCTNENAVCKIDRCECNAGYARVSDESRVCSDVDECKLDLCNKNTGFPGAADQCANTAGGFSCTCKTGFEPAPGSHSCIVPCPCGNNEKKNTVCTNNRCECLSGYARVNSHVCEAKTCKPECDLASEVCELGECECKSGFTKKDGKCEAICSPACDLASEDCTNGKCGCKAGFTEKGGKCEATSTGKNDVNPANSDTGLIQPLKTCTPECILAEHKVCVKGKCECKEGYEDKNKSGICTDATSGATPTLSLPGLLVTIFPLVVTIFMM